MKKFIYRLAIRLFLVTILRANRQPNGNLPYRLDDRIMFKIEDRPYVFQWMAYWDTYADDRIKKPIGERLMTDEGEIAPKFRTNDQTPGESQPADKQNP